MILSLLGSQELHKVTNHPIHLIDADVNLSPTALIPFCSFKKEMSMIGEKVDQFTVPVCNIFKPRILNDQLCYEVDPNKFIQREKNGRTILHLSLFIDYNIERQFSRNSMIPEDFYILINTIGKHL